MTRAIIARTSALVLAFSVLAGAAFAVPPHDHFMTVPGTGAEIQVGPARCALPQTERGFLNFHFNVHEGNQNLVIVADLC